MQVVSRVVWEVTRHPCGYPPFRRDMCVKSLEWRRHKWEVLGMRTLCPYGIAYLRVL